MYTREMYPNSLKKEKVCYDIIFLDPPYPLFKKIGKSLFAQIRKNCILKKDGLLIHEISPEMESNFEDGQSLKLLEIKKDRLTLFSYL